MASYIKKLKDRIEELRRRRSSAQDVATLRGASGVSTPITTTSCGTGSLEGEKAWEVCAPMVELRQHIDLSMDVVLICSIGKPVKLHDVITILEEEGAKIVNANHSVVGHKIFHTIHFQVCIHLWYLQPVANRKHAC